MKNFVDVYHAIHAIRYFPEAHPIVFEYRPPKYMFGCLNYGEIPGFINSADGDPYDVFAPGYTYRLPVKREFFVTDVIGVYFLENGNHKIAVRIDEPSFDKRKASEEIDRYCFTYTQRTRVKGIWVPAF